MDFLFVGTCRGGTAYVTEVLKSLGLRAGHEDVFTRGGVVDWDLYDADVSWVAVPYLEKDWGLEIIRVVRNPMDVINSILRLGMDKEAGFWNYVDGVTNHWDMWKSPQDKVAQFYLDWHEMIDVRAHEWIKVEEGPEPIAYVTGRWSDTLKLFDDRSCNHKDGVGKEVKWDELAAELRGQLLSFADVHGYDVGD